MKLVMDEKLKHRLIGLAVIISLGAIFVPAMIKKSSQKLEDNFSVNINLPQKPIAPEVAVTDEDELFKTIKVSRVELTEVPGEKQLPRLVQAEFTDADTQVTTAALTTAKNEALALDAVKLAAKDGIKVAAKTIVTSKSPVLAKKTIPPIVQSNRIAQSKKIITKPVPVKTNLRASHAKPVIKQAIYAVQLASFSQMTNAHALVNKLHTRGYKATMIRVAGTNGPVYKVVAGHSPNRSEVVRIKAQLASAMQLNGFVVNTGVS